MKGTKTYKKSILFLVSITLIITLLFIFNKEISASKISLPEHPGQNTEQNDKCIIDYSNTDQGYVMVKYTGGNSKVKVQVISRNTYNYDITDSNWTAFPLTDGNGSYTIRVMENIAGNRYSMALSANIGVSLENSVLPFLYSHQRINFNENTSCVKKANSLSNGKKKDLDKVEAIYNWVVGYYKYDHHKAKTVKPGYIPDLNHIYKIKKGICYDYASTTSAMLRSQGIPTKMVFGYVGKDNEYHAWISVYLKEKGWVNNIIHFEERVFTLMDPTFASGGATDPKKLRYIEKTVY